VFILISGVASVYSLLVALLVFILIGGIASVCFIMRYILSKGINLGS